jgi:hypothetical protein
MLKTLLTDDDGIFSSRAIAGNSPNTQPFVLQVTHGFGIRLQCRQPPQLDTSFHGGGKAGVDPLPDYSTLKLRDCHQYAQLKIASRVFLRSVDSLAAADQRDLQPVDFIQNQGQMRQAAAQSIQPTTLPPPPCCHVRNPGLFAEFMQALDGPALDWEG